MANCFTRKSKHPRTNHLQSYVQWTDEISKWRTPKHPIYMPHKKLWPFPAEKLFRPFPPPATQWDPEPDRKLYWGTRQGLKTPEQAIHIGYKHFISDPFSRKLREIGRDKPLPYTLNTEFRVQYQNPNILPTLVYKQNNAKGSLPIDRRCSFGVAPLTLSIPEKGQYYPDEPWWKRDCNT